DGAAEGRLIVCKCVVVREGELREQIRAGATTVRKLRDATEACTGCKTCAVDLKALIACEQEGRPFNPRQLEAPSDTRHGASASDGLTLQGSWSEGEDEDPRWNVQRLPT
ncbi:MAG: (2Fe-2S)-binding protein, partial [Myxococcota bacterium]|nr:(2Fe-2S)-binding protein [Myxococcota bacterium]